MAFYRVSPIGTTKTWLGFTGLVLCALLLPAVLYLTIPDNDGETIPVTLGLESADWAVPVTDQHDTTLECPGTVSLLEQLRHLDLRSQPDSRHLENHLNPGGSRNVPSGGPSAATCRKSSGH